MNLKPDFAALRARFSPKPKEPVEPPADEGTADKSAFVLTSTLALALVCVAFVEWYWAILFCIEAVGKVVFHVEVANGSEKGASLFEWAAAFSGNIPVLVGLVMATIPIVIWSMIWLPTHMATRGRGRWARVTMACVGIMANILVIVSGTVIMNGNRQDQVRAGLVQEQTREAGVDELKRQRAAVDDSLQKMIGPELGNKLQAQAARAGEKGWRATIAAAREVNDPLITARTAAIGSAVAADGYRARIEALDAKIAAAPTQAAVASSVTDTDGAAMNQIATQAIIWRPPFVALSCTLLGIFGAWWLVELYDKLQASRRVMQRPEGWAHEGVMISDQSAEPKLKAAPMDGKYQGDVINDGETGDEMAWVEGYVNKRGKWIPGHYRKTGKKAPVVQDEPSAVFASDPRAARSGVVEEGDESPADPADSTIANRDAAAPDAAGFSADETVGSDLQDDSEQGRDGDAHGDHAVGSDAADLYASLLDTPADELTAGVDYGVEFGPGHASIPLGRDGSDGTLVTDVAAE